MNRRSQSGITYIELLVGMLITSLLGMAVGSFVYTGSRNSQSQKTGEDMNGLARFAAFAISAPVYNAGFTSGRDTAYVRPFVARPALDGQPPFAKNAVVAGMNGGTSGLQSDVLRVRFSSMGELRDCRNQRVGSPGTAPQLQDQALRVVDNTLQCVINDQSGSSQAYDLLEGARALHVSYELDTNGDGRIDQIRADVPLDRQTAIRAVRAELLIESSNRTFEEARERTFEFSDGTQIDLDNRRSYRRVDRTIAIRNP